jgi:hypothetical protein
MSLLRSFNNHSDFFLSVTFEPLSTVCGLLSAGFSGMVRAKMDLADSTRDSGFGRLFLSATFASLSTVYGQLSTGFFGTVRAKIQRRQGKSRSQVVFLGAHFRLQSYETAGS